MVRVRVLREEDVGCARERDDPDALLRPAHGDDETPGHEVVVGADVTVQHLHRSGELVVARISFVEVHEDRSHCHVGEDDEPEHVHLMDDGPARARLSHVHDVHVVDPHLGPFPGPGVVDVDVGVLADHEDEQHGSLRGVGDVRSRMTSSVWATQQPRSCHRGASTAPACSRPPPSVLR